MFEGSRINNQLFMRARARVCVYYSVIEDVSIGFHFRNAHSMYFCKMVRGKSFIGEVRV